ncbi:MAG: polysaccharide biosynthesis tyrosine autokinase [Anaerolineae bacterium]
MELLEYWQILKKRLWLILLLAAVAGATAAYVVSQQTPLYRATTQLLLNPSAQSPLLPYETVESRQSSLANTYAEFMRTRSFAGLVAQELAEGEGATTLPEEEILQALSTQSVPNTQFFRISALHPDPAMAQTLANTAAEVLIAENMARAQAQRLQLEAQRDPAKILERQRLTELQEALQDELDFHSERIADLQGQITDLEARPPSEELDQRILGLREELLNHQSLRVEIFGSLAQTQSSLAGLTEEATAGMDTAVVVDPAALPAQPEPQNLVRYTLLAIVAGLGIGVALVFVLEYVDWTVKTPEQLDAVYGMATLGVIGAFGGRSNGKTGLEEMITVNEPQSPVAEAFRALRTNIQFASPGNPLRSLLVTSAGPQEGKTLTAANLAVSLAQGGSRVLVVDADLRRPRLHKVFAVEREPGLTNLIVDPENGIEPYLQDTQVENLRVLACGPLPRNPAELLGSTRAAEVMERLKEHADVVLYDTPPVATVTDAVVMSSRVDAVIQVVQAGGPRRDVVARAKSLLEKVGARILGPVLNQVGLADVGYYYYYGYYGYSSDGRGRRSRSPLARLARRKEPEGEE